MRSEQNSEMWRITGAAGYSTVADNSTRTYRKASRLSLRRKGAEISGLKFLYYQNEPEDEPLNALNATPVAEKISTEPRESKP